MQGKRILLGVTGGIAAYKIATLVRYFKKAGADVKIIMTPASVDFISPLTLSTLSKNPVYSQYWDSSTGEWSNHVELGLWADVMIIAPATANSLAKMAVGLSDNLLLTTYLSAKCPVFIAPAMDLDMYQHPTTLRNLDQLEQDGVHILPAQKGELASGLNGEGRMMEPEDIFATIEKFFAKNQILKAKKVLVTAGPTYEDLDPVRFIGNHSTGKMGVEIAKALHSFGAEVTLVLGPNGLNEDLSGIQVRPIRSAQNMLEEVQKVWKDQDAGIFAAAVADYRPAEVADQKIKKKDEILQLSLVKNPDILKWAGENKSRQYLMGFALETNNEEENALGKLQAKNLDAIVLNSLQDQGAGFAHDTNKICIFDKDNKRSDFELKSKKSVANDIVSYLSNRI